MQRSGPRNGQRRANGGTYALLVGALAALLSACGTVVPPARESAPAQHPIITPTPAPIVVIDARPTPSPLPTTAPTPTLVRPTVVPEQIARPAGTVVAAVSTFVAQVAPIVLPTPDATQVAQQQYCDTASPPAFLPLPLDVPFFAPPPQAPTQARPTGPGPQRTSADPPPNVTAAHVVVMDEASGQLLFERNPFTRVAPASITKIVTTIVALERQPDVNTMITTTVSSSALVACDGSSVMGLEPQDRVKLQTLLYGMMLPSGNDAAEQVAVSLGGSRERFVEWMNQRVISLGLTDTHFVTPSGMDALDHYSSAYDMAMLGRYAMRNATFRIMAGTARFVGDDYFMRNTNPLIGTYEGADGVKNGFTDAAGRTIVASATRDGHRVYVSLMQSRNLTGDTTALFDWVWRTYRW